VVHSFRLDLLVRVLARTPRTWWRAPGRVNLIGDHTDYCEGFVRPMAIDRGLRRRRGPPGRPPAQGAVAPVRRQRRPRGRHGFEPGSLAPPWGRFVSGVARAAVTWSSTLRSRQGSHFSTP